MFHLRSLFSMFLFLLLGFGVSASGIANQKDSGYRGIWFALGQESEYGDKYSGGLGTYTANHVPMAIYSEEAGKTFFVYGGAKPDSRHLLIMASYYDHAEHRVPRPTIVHDKQGVTDPHDNPSIAMDEKGHVWVFISGRGQRRPGFKYRSVSPYSVEEFELISEEEMTYPQPWWVEGKGFFHLFTKYTNGRELYWETSPDGETWTEDRKLAGIGGHYQISSARDGKIGSFFNRHPGGKVDRRTDLYYVQTTDFGETWTTVDGRKLEIPLETDDNPARIFTYSEEGRLVYTVDLNWDREGNPVLLYVTSGGHQPGPENEPRNWEIAHWDGTKWRNRIVTRSTHNYDLGSLHVSGDRWTIIGPTGEGPQRWGAGGEVEIWESDDAGETWTKTREVTRNSVRNHTFVRRPENARDPFFAFWADGNTDEPCESVLYFGESSGERYWALPAAMEGEFAAPREISAKEADFRVLVFSYTTGFRHNSISAGIAAVERLGWENGFAVEKTEDPAVFTKENLAEYAAVIFMNTNGTLFNDSQRAALTAYIRAGGGYVGVHSASATEYDWDWYRELVGAHFDKHPKVQPAVVRVENREHISTRHLPERWEHTDEWYNFRRNPRHATNVLLSLDTETMEGSTMDGDHPLAWYREFDGGRTWYTALGHTNECYADPDFLQHLLGGIRWASGETNE